MGKNRIIDTIFFHEKPVSRDQPLKMCGTDLDQFPRSFYPNFDYSRHTCSCEDIVVQSVLCRYLIVCIYMNLSACADDRIVAI